MICRHCDHTHDGRTVGFGAVCESCGEYLHACFNCTLYNLNAERCRSHTTETVSSRKGRNFCEEFIPNTNSEMEQDSVKEKTTDDFNTLFNTDGE